MKKLNLMIRGKEDIMYDIIIVGAGPAGLTSEYVVEKAF